MITEQKLKELDRWVHDKYRESTASDWQNAAELLTAFSRLVKLVVRRHPKTGLWYQFDNPFKPYPDREAAVTALMEALDET